jgi:methylated-DNA-[protein]-cysteine S-methyltransferase
MTRYTHIPTPHGTLLATARDGALTGLYFESQKYFPQADPTWLEDPRAAPLAECARQVREYFEGTRTQFDLPLAAEGTDFQRRVWQEIAAIPYGKTITYSELAARAGAPGSARAAGAATGRNPISIVVPCHRVVGADGSLTGYAGGLHRKAHLLEIEGVLTGVPV